MSRIFQKIKNIFFLAVLFSSFCSCETYDPLFRVPANEVLSAFEKAPYQEPMIRFGDKITISVWGHEDLSIGSVNSTFSSNEATGRWLVIDKVGEVNLPRIGRVRLEGYNVKEANYFLERLYERAGIKEPIVNIRILSHFVTLLGEVNAPGRYQIDNEVITLIEMIGKAQGLTQYAKADEVRIIRKMTDGKVQEVQINLTSYQSLSTDNYILKPDDLIYIPPTQMKHIDKTVEKITPIAGILTSVAVIFSVFFK